VNECCDVDLLEVNRCHCSVDDHSLDAATGSDHQASELESRATYRSIEAELLPDPTFAELSDETQRRLASTRVALETRMLELVRLTAPDGAQTLAERMRALDPLLLANAIAFGLDCPTLEKQTLLECVDPLAQVELLLRVLAFRIAEARLPEGPKTVN